MLSMSFLKPVRRLPAGSTSASLSSPALALPFPVPTVPTMPHAGVRRRAGSLCANPVMLSIPAMVHTSQCRSSVNGQFCVQAAHSDWGKGCQTFSLRCDSVRRPRPHQSVIRTHPRSTASSTPASTSDIPFQSCPSVEMCTRLTRGDAGVQMLNCLKDTQVEVGITHLQSLSVGLQQS